MSHSAPDGQSSGDEGRPDTTRRSTGTVFAVLGVLVAVVVGGFVVWLQVGLAYSLALLGSGGLGLQDHLSRAATSLTAGDYRAGEVEYERAVESTLVLEQSVGSPQVRFLEQFQGFATAVENWQHVVVAAGHITSATGELIGLYGDLAGQKDSEKIFSDGAIDIERLESVAPRVDFVLDDLAQAEANLVSIQAKGEWAEPLDDIRNRALEEMTPVATAVEVLVDISPLLPSALGADGPRRYLIAIGNQAEMRASFGAPLTLVMVEFDDGRISIPIKGQTSTELFPPLNARVQWFGPGYNPFFKGNQRNRPFVVSNTHPNLLFSAQEMAGSWAGGNYPEVDGVVALDLTAIAAVLDATGPIESPVYGTVTGDQIGQILLIDAYAQFGQDDAVARQQANQQLLDELLRRILSGDDLVHRCAVELPNVSRVVFAMGGADGVLRKPPHEATEEDLIEVWHDAADFVGVHAADMDVTGGIGLKVQRARSIAQHGIETWFVNGEVEGRLEAAMLGRPVRGTRFPPAQKG